MKFGISSFVTAIVTTIVTNALFFVTPASAEILTVCANTTQSSAVQPPPPPQRFADAIIPLGSTTAARDDGLIALWRDDNGFDLLMDWGEARQRSLRAEGAQIIGATPTSELVHLMVAHADGGLEHFLFNLDEKGSGRLLRSLASDIAGASGPASSSTACVKPH